MTGSCVTDANVACANPNLQEYLAGEPVSGGLNLREHLLPEHDKRGWRSGKGRAGHSVHVRAHTRLGTIKLTADATMRLEQKPGRYGAGLAVTTC